MGVYTTLIVELLLIVSSILLFFKFRRKLGLAPLYILLGSLQYLQTLAGTVVHVEILNGITLYPGSAIIFSAGLFAVLLIYIKEGVTAARNIIFGIVASNLLLIAFFAITYQQELAAGVSNVDSSSIFFINNKNFVLGTSVLLLDFILLVIIYQYLISKIKKVHFFLIIFLSLFLTLIFDAFAFNFALFYETPLFKNSLISHLIVKPFAALVFSIILYFYLEYLGNEKTTTFIDTQNRNIFSIINYKKRYEELKIEKSRVEKKLTSKLEASLHNISDGFVSLDKNWCYTYINKKGAEFLGKSPESLIGKNIWKEFPEGVESKFYVAYHKAFKTQKTIYFEDYYEPFDTWFENRVYPSPDGLTIYFTNITEQKKADLALKESENHIRTILEAEPECIKQLNAKGELIYMNPAGLEMIEADNFEMVKDQPVINLIMPEYQKAFKKLSNQIFNGQSGKLEFQIKGLKGTKRWLETHAVPFKDTEGNIISLLGVTRDVSEHKEAQEKLKNNELLFRRLSSSAPVGIFQTDKEGSCNYVNEEWLNYTGMAFHEAMGFGFADAFHPDDKERVVHEWQQYALSGGEFNIEFRFQNKKNNNITWISVKSVETYDANNNLYGYIGMALDITDRKKAEEQIRKSEEYLNNIINNIGDPVFVKDKNSRFLLANDAFYELFNRTKEEIIGNTFADDVPQEVRERYLQIDKEVITKGIENIDEDSVEFEGEETRYISTKKIRFIAKSGKIFLIGVIRDITKIKNTEKLLIESRNYLDNIINNIGDPVFVKDNESRLVIVNNAFCEIFNLKRDDVIGKTLAENVPPEEMKSFFRIDNQVISTGIENVNEETLTIKNNETKIISTKKTRFVDKSGSKFLIGIIRDITERRKAEEEIRTANQRLTTHLNNSPLAIIEWDKNFIIRNWSVQAKNIFGWKESEAIGKHFNDLNLVFEEDVPDTSIIIDELLNNKVKSNRIINRNYTKKRNIIYCEWYNSVLRSPEGQIETIFSLVEDITERKKAENDLEIYKNNLEELVETRTEEVNSKNAELQRMNKLFVGRELRMKELKNIIKELQKKNDK